MTNTPQIIQPVFDKHVPMPHKHREDCQLSKRAYLVGQENFSITHALSLMEIGDSCLLSNWATTSVHYSQSKTGYKFTRQIQDDGTVRIWRVK